MIRSDVYNCDCVEYMRSLPNKTFDLAIADPPYGDAAVNEGVSPPPLNILRKRQKYNRFGGLFDTYKKMEPQYLLRAERNLQSSIKKRH